MTPHFQDDDITIHKLECGPYGNNAYLVVCRRTNESILIDTPAEPDELIKLAKTTDVKAILITHNHMDHLLGFDDVTAAIQAPSRHWHGRRRRPVDARGHPAERRRCRVRRQRQPHRGVHARTHARLYLLLHGNAPLLRRHLVPRRTRQVKLAREPQTAHREHYDQALHAR